MLKVRMLQIGCSMMGEVGQGEVEAFRSLVVSIVVHRGGKSVGGASVRVVGIGVSMAEVEGRVLGRGSGRRETRRGWLEVLLVVGSESVGKNLIQIRTSGW